MSQIIIQNILKCIELLLNVLKLHNKINSCEFILIDINLVTKSLKLDEKSKKAKKSLIIRF